MKRAVRLTRKWAKRGYYIIFAGMIVTSAAALAQIIWMGMVKFTMLEGARPGWMTPLMMAGIVMQAMSNAMICAVIVVPMFAPKMIPIDWVRFRSPAFTNPITITVLALDDWMTAVTSAPARTATNRLLENR